MSCQYCSKEKYYYSYHRHTSKCYNRQIDPNFILNFFNFINEYDQDNVICQLCKKFTAELLICSSCKTNKCINCKICNKNCCSECILEVAQQNQNIQLQCKAEFCREIVKVDNVFSHYQICNYRLKKCRTKLCNWEGYKMYYQDHECQNKIEFHSNQTHSIKYAQMLDIKEYRKVSQLQQKTIMKIKLYQNFGLIIKPYQYYPKQQLIYKACQNFYFY
ncbi:hypothetical protein pb186bvf_013600 [Paramecium bursaria]